MLDGERRLRVEIEFFEKWGEANLTTVKGEDL